MFPRVPIITRRLLDAIRVGRNVRRGLPIWAFVWVTRKCGQNCPHCYVYNNSIPHMKWDLYERIVRKLVELRVIYMSVFGGEPALHPELPAMIRHGKAHGLRIYLNTDITATSSDRQRQLITAGTDVLSFSMDSATPYGPSSRCIATVDDRLDALASLQRARAPFALHCNVTWHKGNLAEAEEVVTYLHRKARIGISVRLAVYPPVARDPTGTENPLALGPEDAPRLRELGNWLIARKREGYRIVNPSWYLRDLARHVIGDLDWDCGAMRDILSIDTDGTLMQCSYYLPDAPFGPIPIRPHIDRLTPEVVRRARVAVESNLKSCNRACISPAYSGTSYFRSHRLELLRTYLRT